MTNPALIRMVALTRQEDLLRAAERNRLAASLRRSEPAPARWFRWSLRRRPRPVAAAACATRG